MSEWSPKYMDWVIAELDAGDLMPGAQHTGKFNTPHDWLWHGKTVNVKRAETSHSPIKGRRWAFQLNCNTAPDLFVLVGYSGQDRVAAWMIPSETVIGRRSIVLYESDLPNYRLFSRELGLVELPALVGLQAGPRRSERTQQRLVRTPIKCASLWLPEELHAAAVAEVERRKKTAPGASLNSLMCEALAAYLKQAPKRGD